MVTARGQALRVSECAASMPYSAIFSRISSFSCLARASSTVSSDKTSRAFAGTSGGAAQGAEGAAGEGGAAPSTCGPLISALFRSSHADVAVKTVPGSGTSRLRLGLKDSHLTCTPFLSSRWTMNLYSMALPVGMASCGVDHTGNMSDDVDILTAWTGFQFPNGSPLPTTKTASPGRVAWQLTLKTTDAIATVRGKRQGGR
mmetsp:Transcript_1843/g.5301  ORF Transcript_1843/g.5301 Transcript_1843/m.5301 type:complete len:201 (-) Transcript_1843:8-610(-)